MKFIAWLILTASLGLWAYWYGRGVERYRDRLKAAAFSEYSRRLQRERDACMEYLDEDPYPEQKVIIEDISI